MSSSVTLGSDSKVSQLRVAEVVKRKYKHVH